MTPTTGRTSPPLRSFTDPFAIPLPEACRYLGTADGLVSVTARAWRLPMPVLRTMSESGGRA